MKIPNKKMIQLPHGETIAYVEQGHGPKTILLVHGNMSSSIHYVPLLERIPEEYRVIAPDMRGFGDSTYHHEFNSLQELATEMIHLMDALHVEQASVVGWSTGGGVALLMAAHHPTRVERIFLIESTGYNGYPIFQKDEKGQPKMGVPYLSKKDMAKDPIQVVPAQQAMETNNVAFMDYLWNLAIYTGAHKPTPEANQLYLAETLKQRCLADIDWSLAALNMGHTPNLYGPGDGSIDRVTCPVLSIWGNKDITVPEYMVRTTVEAIGENATLKVYDNCGHSPLVDAPDQLAKDLLEFIQ
jgi:pimeloyl-ACP methyl ester carboxylesterase